MNAADTQDVKTLLTDVHGPYRVLSEQHHQLDDRLHELARKHFLSATEHFEEVVLKKRKLALKDRMERVARAYVTLHAATSSDGHR